MSSSHFSMVDSRFLISSLSLVASAVTYKDKIIQLGQIRNKYLGSSLLDLVDLVVLTLDTGVGGINLLLQVVPGSLKTVGLVNDVLRKYS